MDNDDFFPEIDLNESQADAIARGLYAIAMVDGVHERELALIGDFFGSTHDSIATLERVGPLTPKDVAQLLIGAPQRELFVKTALLLAWADGNVSDAERAKVAEFAKALGVSDEIQEKLESAVKDYLLRPFAGINNLDAVAELVKKLDL